MVFEDKWKTKVESEVHVYAQNPKSEPCLQIIDYMIWSVQRAFVKKEMRYLEFVRSKISLIADIYDFKNFGRNFYARKNKFELEKVSPL